VHNPAAFDFAHSVMWEGFLILAILGLWLGWTRWSDSVRAEPSLRTIGLCKPVAQD